MLEEDEESALTAWSGTLVDERHTELFDHIYESNHIGELKYLTEIERILAQDPAKQTLDLNYDDDDEHKAWVNSWKIRVVNSETVLNNTIKVIQETKKGERLGRIYLRPNHIYIAKYRYNDRDYPIAIYNAGTSEVMDKVFTKVEITDIDQLDEDENKKRIYIEETFFSYFIVAFYEDGKSTPTLMIQVEKFPFSDLMHNSMEEWMKFLKILVEERTINSNVVKLTPGEERAELARQKDIQDVRTYYTPVLMPQKKTDNFVDCSEFTNEIALSQGIDITYGSDEQLAWFKQNGKYGTNWSDAKVGDVIFWDRKYRSCTIEEKNANLCQCEKKSKGTWYKDVSSFNDVDHVGILVELDSNSKTGKVVHASVQGYTNPSINEITISSNGNIYDSSCDQMTFIAWGRIEK